MSERSDRQLLLDMQEAVERIQRYTAGMNLQGFMGDEMIADAVMRNIQIIGEAANRTSATLRNDFPQVEWSRIIGMRHRLVHDYFEIEETIVWRVIESKLPVLAEQLTMMLDSGVK